jgi:nicotinate-nucleotide adenylyltransferase
VQLRLSRVLWVPAAAPPHKRVEDEPGPAHRLELCRCAVDGDARFEASAIEVLRPGPSYTVDTLLELQSTVPESELYLIVGGDIAVGLPSWHEGERVLSLARLAVAKRRGTSRDSVGSVLAGMRGGERARFFRMPRIGISSTMIRRRVRAGQPISYLVPSAVERYIEAHGLYGGPTS